MAIPKTLKDFTVFVDGRGQLGKATEVELPKLTLKTEEHRAGGMVAPVEIDLGIEKLEATMTFAEADPDLLGLFGIKQDNGVAVTLRGALSDGPNTVPMVINLRGYIKELDGGTWKAGEPGSLKLGMAVDYYRAAIDGTDVIEIDAVNMIHVVGGQDQLAATRQALGV